MGKAFGVGMAVAFVVVSMGVAGYRIAKTQNRNTVVGFLVGALIPIVGLGALLLLGSKTKKR